MVQAFRHHGGWIAAAFCGLLCAAQTIGPLSEPIDSLGSPALSPDGKLLAYGFGDLSVRPLAGGRPIPFAGEAESGFPANPRWSPDGHQIAFLRYFCRMCNDKLYVKDYPKGPERSLGEVCESSPSWTPDGKFLIAAEQAGQYPGWTPCRLVRIPADGRGPRLRLANEGDQLALSRDGRRLAYAVGSIVKTVALDSNYRFASKPVIVAREPHEIATLHWSNSGDSLLYEVWGAAKVITNGASRVVVTNRRVWISQILPDGAALAVEDGQTATLWRRDLKANNTQPQKVRSIPWTDHDLSVSPSGDQVAFLTTRKGVPQIWLSNLDGSNARVLVAAIPPFHRYGDRTSVSGPSWSPDGKWIAIGTDPGIGHGDTSGRVFIVPSKGGVLRKIADIAAVGRSPLWSPTSDAIYVIDHVNNFFAASLATPGRLQPVAKSALPKPSTEVDGGRYQYTVTRPDLPSLRLVRIENLFPQTQKAR